MIEKYITNASIGPLGIQCQGSEANSRGIDVGLLLILTPDHHRFHFEMSDVPCG